VRQGRWNNQRMPLGRTAQRIAGDGARAESKSWRVRRRGAGKNLIIVDARTYVRMYVIFSRADPHIALDTGETLDSIATALASRPERGLMVCVNEDGLSRPLQVAEQRELDERIGELRCSRAKARDPEHAPQYGSCNSRARRAAWLRKAKCSMRWTSPAPASRETPSSASLVPSSRASSSTVHRYDELNSRRRISSSSARGRSRLTHRAARSYVFVGVPEDSPSVVKGPPIVDVSFSIVGLCPLARAVDRRTEQLGPDLQSLGHRLPRLKCECVALSKTRRTRRFT